MCNKSLAKAEERKREKKVSNFLLMIQIWLLLYDDDGSDIVGLLL
jgi:hypothetical protein